MSFYDNYDEEDGGGQVSPSLYGTRQRRPLESPVIRNSLKRDAGKPYGYQLEAWRANTQGVPAMVVNGIGRFVGTTITKTLEDVGYLAGLAGWNDSKGDPNKSWVAGAADNVFAGMMSDTEDWIKEQLPIYKSLKYQNGDVFTQMKTMGFWMDDVVDGAAFMVSAYAPGLGTMKLAKTLNFSKYLSRANTFGELLPVVTKNAKRIENGALWGTTWALQTAGESMFEAKDALDATRRNLQGTINPETGQLYTPEEIKIISSNNASNVFKENMAALAISNAIETRFLFNILGKKSIAASGKLFATNTANDLVTNPANALKRIYKGTTARTLGGFAAGVATEGLWEENIQYSIQKANDGIDDFHSNNTLDNMLSYLPELFDFEDEDRKKSVVLGGILGGPMGGTSSFLNSRREKNLQKKGPSFIKQKDQEFLGLDIFKTEDVGKISLEEKDGKIFVKDDDGIHESTPQELEELKTKYGVEMGKPYAGRKSMVIEDGKPVIDEDKAKNYAKKVEFIDDIMYLIDTEQNKEVSDQNYIKHLRNILFQSWAKSHMDIGAYDQLIQRLNNFKSMDKASMQLFNIDPNENVNTVIEEWKRKAEKLKDQYESIENMVGPGRRKDRDDVARLKSYLYHIAADVDSLQDWRDKVQSKMAPSTNSLQIDEINNAVRSYNVLRSQYESLLLEGKDAKEAYNMMNIERDNILNLKKEYNTNNNTDMPLDTFKVGDTTSINEAMREINASKKAAIDSAITDLNNRWIRYTDPSTGLKNFQKEIKGDGKYQEAALFVNEKTTKSDFDIFLNSNLRRYRLSQQVSDIRDQLINDRAAEAIKNGENPIDIFNSLKGVRVSPELKPKLLTLFDQILDEIEPDISPNMVEYDENERPLRPITYTEADVEEDAENMGSDPAALEKGWQQYWEVKRNKENFESFEPEARKELTDDEVKYRIITQKWHQIPLSVLERYILQPDFMDEAGQIPELIKTLRHLAPFIKDIEGQHALRSPYKSELQDTFNVKLGQMSLSEQNEVLIKMLTKAEEETKTRKVNHDKMNKEFDEQFLSDLQQRLGMVIQDGKINFPDKEMGDIITALPGYDEMISKQDLSKGFNIGMYHWIIHTLKYTDKKDAMLKLLAERREKALKDYEEVAIYSIGDPWQTNEFYPENPVSVFIGSIRSISIGQTVIKEPGQPIHDFLTDNDVNKFIKALEEKSDTALANIAKAHKKYSEIYGIIEDIESDVNIPDVNDTMISYLDMQKKAFDANNETGYVAPLSVQQEYLAYKAIVYLKKKNLDNAYQAITQITGLAGTGKTNVVLPWLLKMANIDAKDVLPVSYAKDPADNLAKVVSQDEGRTTMEIVNDPSLLKDVKLLVVDEFNNMGVVAFDRFMHTLYNYFEQNGDTGLRVLFLGDPLQMKEYEEGISEGFIVSETFGPLALQQTEDDRMQNYAAYINRLPMLNIVYRSYVGAIRNTSDIFKASTRDNYKGVITTEVNRADFMTTTEEITGVSGVEDFNTWLANTVTILKNQKNEKSKIVIVNDDESKAYVEKVLKDENLNVPVLLYGKAAGLTRNMVFLYLPKESKRDNTSMNSVVYTMINRATDFVYLGGFRINTNIDQTFGKVNERIKQQRIDDIRVRFEEFAEKLNKEDELYGDAPQNDEDVDATNPKKKTDETGKKKPDDTVTKQPEGTITLGNPTIAGLDHVEGNEDPKIDDDVIIVAEKKGKRNIVSAYVDHKNGFYRYLGEISSQQFDEWGLSFPTDSKKLAVFNTTDVGENIFELATEKGVGILRRAKYKGHQKFKFVYLNEPVMVKGKRELVEDYVKATGMRVDNMDALVNESKFVISTKSNDIEINEGQLALMIGNNPNHYIRLDARKMHESDTVFKYIKILKAKLKEFDKITGLDYDKRTDLYGIFLRAVVDDTIDNEYGDGTVTIRQAVEQIRGKAFSNEDIAILQKVTNAIDNLLYGRTEKTNQRVLDTGPLTRELDDMALANLFADEICLKYYRIHRHGRGRPTERTRCAVPILTAIDRTVKHIDEDGNHVEAISHDLWKNMLDYQIKQFEIVGEKELKEAYEIARQEYNHRMQGWTYEAFDNLLSFDEDGYSNVNKGFGLRYNIKKKSPDKFVKSDVDRLNEGDFSNIRNSFKQFIPSQIYLELTEKKEENTVSQEKTEGAKNGYKPMSDKFDADYFGETSEDLGRGLTEKETEKVLKQRMPNMSEEDYKYMSRLAILSTVGKDVRGAMESGTGMIYLLQNEQGLVPEKVVLHEALHRVFNLYLTNDEREELYEEARNRYGEKSDKELREDLANDYMRWIRKKIIIKGKLFRTFKWLYDLINWIGEQFGLHKDKIDTFFDLIDRGYFFKYSSEQLPDTEYLINFNDYKVDNTTTDQEAFRIYAKARKEVMLVLNANLDATNIDFVEDDNTKQLKCKIEDIDVDESNFINDLPVPVSFYDARVNALKYLIDYINNPANEEKKGTLAYKAVQALTKHTSHKNEDGKVISEKYYVFEQLIEDIFPLDEDVDTETTDELGFAFENWDKGKDEVDPRRRQTRNISRRLMNMLYPRNGKLYNLPYAYVNAVMYNGFRSYKNNVADMWQDAFDSIGRKPDTVMLLTWLRYVNDRANEYDTSEPFFFDKDTFVLNGVKNYEEFSEVIRSGIASRNVIRKTKDMSIGAFLREIARRREEPASPEIIKKYADLYKAQHFYSLRNEITTYYNSHDKTNPYRVTEFAKKKRAQPLHKISETNATSYTFGDIQSLFYDIFSAGIVTNNIKNLVNKESLKTIDVPLLTAALKDFGLSDTWIKDLTKPSVLKKSGAELVSLIADYLKEVETAKAEQMDSDWSDFITDQFNRISSITDEFYDRDIRKTASSYGTRTDNNRRYMYTLTSNGRTVLNKFMDGNLEMSTNNKKNNIFSKRLNAIHSLISIVEWVHESNLRKPYLVSEETRIQRIRREFISGFLDFSDRKNKRFALDLYGIADKKQCNAVIVNTLNESELYQAAKDAVIFEMSRIDPTKHIKLQRTNYVKNWKKSYIIGIKEYDYENRIVTLDNGHTVSFDEIGTITNHVISALKQKANKYFDNHYDDFLVTRKGKKEFPVPVELGEYNSYVDPTIKSEYGNDTIRQLFVLWYQNHFLNSFHATNLFVQDKAFYKNSREAQKRMGIVFAESYGQKDAGKFDYDTRISVGEELTEDISDVIDEQFLDLFKAFSGETYDYTDSMVLATPEQIELEHTRYGRDMPVGNTLKPVITGYEIVKVGDDIIYVPVNIKCAVFTLDDWLCEEYPALNVLRDNMRKYNIGYHAIKSAVKTGAPEEALGHSKVNGNDRFDLVNDNNFDRVTITLPQDAFRMVFNPEKNVDQPQVNNVQMSRKLHETGDPKVYELAKHHWQIEAKRLELLYGKADNLLGARDTFRAEMARAIEHSPGGQVLYDYIKNPDISVNDPMLAPTLVKRVVMYMTKNVLRKRLPGSDLILQPSYGVETVKGKKRRLRFRDKDNCCEVIISKELQDKIPKGIVDDTYAEMLFGYRMPTSALHLGLALKVVGYADVKSNIIICPRLLVLMHGIDFDIDSMHLYLFKEEPNNIPGYNTYGKVVFHIDGKPYYQILENLLKNKSWQRENEVSTYQLQQSLEVAYNNSLIKNYIDINRNAYIQKQMNSPITLDVQKELYPEQEISDNLDDPFVNAQLTYEANVAKELIGFFISATSGVDYLLNTNEEKKAPLTRQKPNTKEREPISIKFTNGKATMELDELQTKEWTFNENEVVEKEYRLRKDGAMIKSSLAMTFDSVGNAIIDSINNGMVNRIGIDRNNYTIYIAAYAMGIDQEWIKYIMSNPVIKKYIQIRRTNRKNDLNDFLTKYQPNSDPVDIRKLKQYATTELDSEAFKRHIGSVINVVASLYDVGTFIQKVGSATSAMRDFGSDYSSLKKHLSAFKSLYNIKSIDDIRPSADNLAQDNNITNIPNIHQVLSMLIDINSSIENKFDRYSPFITRLINELDKKVKLLLGTKGEEGGFKLHYDDDYHKEALRDEVIRYLMSSMSFYYRGVSIDLDTTNELPINKLVKGKEEGTSTYTGLDAFNERVYRRRNELLIELRNNDRENTFLDYIWINETWGHRSLKSRLYFNDDPMYLKKAQMAFMLLDEEDRAMFIKYAILNQVLGFGTTNIAQMIPDTEWIYFSKAYENEIQKLIRDVKNEEDPDIVKLETHFIHQVLINNVEGIYGSEIGWKDSEFVKVDGHLMGSDVIDGKRIYYDRKVSKSQVSDSKAPLYIKTPGRLFIKMELTQDSIKKNEDGQYVKTSVEIPELAKSDYIYYQEVTKERSKGYTLTKQIRTHGFDLASMFNPFRKCFVVKSMMPTIEISNDPKYNQPVTKGDTVLVRTSSDPSRSNAKFYIVDSINKKEDKTIVTLVESPTQNPDVKVPKKKVKEQRVDVNSDNINQDITEYIDDIRRTGVTIVEYSDPDDHRKGFYENGTVYVNRYYSTADTPFHEITHPWIEYIRINDPDAWEEIKEGITEEDLQRVGALNPHLSGEDLSVEVIATIVGEEAANNLHEPRLKRFAKKVIRYILDALESLFNTKITIYTPLKDLASRVAYSRNLPFMNMTKEQQADFINSQVAKPAFDALIDGEKDVVSYKIGNQLKYKKGTKDGISSLHEVIDEQITGFKDEDRIDHNARNIIYSITYVPRDKITDAHRINYVDRTGKSHNVNLEELKVILTNEQSDVRNNGTLNHAETSKMFILSPEKRREVDQAMREVTSQLIYQGDRARDYRWIHQKQSSLYNRLNARFNYYNLATEDVVTNYKPSEALDTPIAEFAMYDEDLNWGSTVDLLIGKPGDIVSIYDWGFGKGYLNDFSYRILKYSPESELSYHNPRDLKFLQLVVRMFMIKKKQPNIRFDVAQVMVFNKADDILTFDADVDNKLKLIENWIKAEYSDLYQGLKDKGLFDFQSYMVYGNNDASEQDKIEGKTDEDVIRYYEAKMTEIYYQLRSTYNVYLTGEKVEKGVQSQDMYEGKTESEIRKIAGLRARYIELGKKVDAYRKAENVDLSSEKHDISWLRKHLGSGYESGSKHYATWYNMFIHNKMLANKKKDEIQKKFEQLLNAVIEEKHSNGRFSRVIRDLKGVDIAKFFSFMYVVEGNTARLVTRNDSAWNNLSTAERNFIEHLQTSMGAKYKDVVGRVAYHKQINGRDVPVHIYEIRQTNRDTLPQTIESSFLPKHPISMNEMSQRMIAEGKALSGLKRSFNRVMEDYYDQYNYGKIDSGIVPIKYLGNSDVAETMNHSLNPCVWYLAFMNNLIDKEYMEDVAAYGRYVEMALSAKGMKNTSDYINKQMPHLVFGQKQPIKFFRKPIYIKMGEGKTLDINRLLLGPKNFVTFSTMALAASVATFNNMLILMYTHKKAISGSIAKSLGVPPEDLDYGLKEIGFADKEYWKLVVDTFLGRLEKNKLYNIARNTRYLTDNYDMKLHSTAAMIGTSKVLDSSWLYFMHRIGEDYGNYSVLAAMLKHMKFDGVSLWDMYDDNGDYIGPNGQEGRRGYIKHSDGRMEELKGITSEEMIRLKRVSQRLNGSYRPEEKMLIEANVAGQYIMQFKKYLPAITLNIWSSSFDDPSIGKYVKSKDIKQGTDDVYVWQAREFKGMYSSLWHMAGLTLKMKNANFNEQVWNELSSTEKAQISDFLAAAMMIPMWLLIAGAAFDDDDKERNLYVRLQRLFWEDNTQAMNPMDILRSFQTQTAVFPKVWKISNALGDFFWRGLLKGERLENGRYPGELVLKQNSIPPWSTFAGINKYLNESRKEDEITFWGLFDGIDNTRK